MMTGHRILGIGIDLIDNDRIRDMLERWGDRFKSRIFLTAEQVYCESKADPAPHYAGRFAAKEAVSKALGTGMGAHISWLDIEIIRDSNTGAPGIRLSPRAQNYLATRQASTVLVSFSHTPTQSIAEAILLAEA